MRSARGPSQEKPTAELGQRGGLGLDEQLGLVVLTAAGIKMLPLPLSGEVVIGRSQAADLQIDIESLSRRHAMLQLGPAPRLKDLGSSNGTRVGGAEVGPDWVAVRIGEAIQLGSVTVLLQPMAAAARPQRRLCSHDYFEARLEEECRRGGAPFAVLRVHVGARLEEAATVLSAALAPDDCLAMYAPREYEALAFGVDGERAAKLAEGLEASTLEARVGVACFPAQGRTAEQLIGAANAKLTGAAATPGEKFVVESPAMRELYEIVDRIAVGNISVLVTGETGVGKEVIAAAIHARSLRAKKPYLTLNCAAFTETLLESELFGHEKGAFTGATEAKPGLFEAAQGGTVFLDEIGELPPATQVKLLRVLEERALRRVGSLKSRSIDLRIVAATNRDLEAEVSAGRFRQDLYFRIGGVTLHVPPLRSRLEELEPLAKHFVAGFARQLGRRPPALSPEALGLMRAYRWPGNIRELRNMMERAVLLCGGASIGPEHLPGDKLAAVWVAQPAAGAQAPVRAPSRPADEEPDERQRIVDALAQCGGNQTRAAKLLGISRRTLIYRLDAMKIPRPHKQVPRP